MVKCILCCHLRAGYEFLQKLVERDYFDKILLFTYRERVNSKLVDFANKNDIEVKYGDINNYQERVENFQPDYLFSVYYRDIISEEILDCIKEESVNLHPSLLPKHKGTFSAPWAILENDKVTGITYHEMEEKVDEGKIILQRQIGIGENDTAYSLYNKLVDLGILHFDEMFERVIHSEDAGEEHKGNSCYHPRETPYDGKISLEWSPNFIERFIRAMYFPPHEGAILEYNGQQYEFKSTKKFREFRKDEDISLGDLDPTKE